VKKLVIAPCYVNSYWEIPARSSFNKLTTDLPGGILIKIRELKFLLLLKQLLQYVIHVNIL
jgi:hypothetical protein